MTQPSAQEPELFDEGVAAARRGDRVKAREAFTRLMRTDKNNEEAWLWMSSVVATDRERIYCLNTAMKLNPQSKSALRGLAILGALPPELRPQPIEIGGDGETADPAIQVQRRRRFRLRRSRRLEFVLIALVILLIAAIGLVFVGNQITENIRLAQITPSVTATLTLTPSATPTVTPTATSEIRTVTPVPTAAEQQISLEQVLELERLPTATALPAALDNFYPIGDSDLRAGINAYTAGQYNQAIELLSAALETNSEMVEAPYYSGLSYLELANYLQAAEQFNRAVELQASFAPAFVGRGRANFGLGFDPIRHYQDAIALEPTYAEGYIYQAIYHELTGQPEGALENLSLGLQIIPDHVELKWRLAAQLLIMGNPDGALEQVNSALERDPTARGAYLTRGKILNVLGRYADAQADLNIYTFLEQDDPIGWRSLAEAFIGLGDSQTSYTYLTRALELAPGSTDLLIARGNISLELQDYPAAEADFFAAENFTNSVEARIGLGAAKLGQGLLEEARVEFARAVELAPDAYEPLFRWALAELSIGDLFAAEARLSEALNLANTTLKMAQVRFERAKVLAATQRDNEAIADLRVLLTFNLPPSQDGLRAEAGELLSSLGGPLPGPTHTPISSEQG